jgi:hypothetical protein
MVARIAGIESKAVIFVNNIPHLKHAYFDVSFDYLDMTLVDKSRVVT